MTLTIERVQDAVQLHPPTKLFGSMSNVSAMRVLTDEHTDTGKNGTNSVTTNADAGVIECLEKLGGLNIL